MRGASSHLDLVHGAGAVVKESAGLGENHESLGADMVKRRGGGAIEFRKIALERRLCCTLTNELQIGSHLSVVAGSVEQGALGVGHGLVREGHLATGSDGH